MDKISVIKQMKKEKLPQEISNESILSDLLWSEPQENVDSTEFNFAPNGLGYKFPLYYTQEFLDKNNLSLIIWSNTFLENGIQKYHNEKIISIFSATYHGSNSN